MIIDPEKAKREKEARELYEKQLAQQQKQLAIQEKMTKILMAKRSVAVTKTDGTVTNYEADLVNNENGLYTMYFEEKNEIIKIPVVNILEISEILKV